VVLAAGDTADSGSQAALALRLPHKKMRDNFPAIV
jgi:hypothetical protein